jgi:hypothetical protein
MSPSLISGDERDLSKVEILFTHATRSKNMEVKVLPRNSWTYEKYEENWRTLEKRPRKLVKTLLKMVENGRKVVKRLSKMFKMAEKWSEMVKTG